LTALGWHTLRGRQPKPIREWIEVQRDLSSPQKPGIRKELKGERKAVASVADWARPDRPLPQRQAQEADSDQCWWCEAEEKQTREHLFKHCKRWKPEINVLWATIGKSWDGSVLGTRRYLNCSGGGRFCNFRRIRMSGNQEWGVKTSHARLG